MGPCKGRLVTGPPIDWGALVEHSLSPIDWGALVEQNIFISDTTSRKCGTKTRLGPNDTAGEGSLRHVQVKNEGGTQTYRQTDDNFFFYF